MGSPIILDLEGTFARIGAKIPRHPYSTKLLFASASYSFSIAVTWQRGSCESPLSCVVVIDKTAPNVPNSFRYKEVCVEVSLVLSHVPTVDLAVDGQLIRDVNRVILFGIVSCHRTYDSMSVCPVLGLSSGTGS